MTVQFPGSRSAFLVSAVTFYERAAGKRRRGPTISSEHNDVSRAIRGSVEFAIFGAGGGTEGERETENIRVRRIVRALAPARPFATTAAAERQ